MTRLIAPGFASVSKNAYATATVPRLQRSHETQRITVSTSLLDREGTVVMNGDSVPGIDRRRLISWGGLAAAGVPLAGARIGHTGSTPTVAAGPDPIPPDTLPGGAYDRYVAQLAAHGASAGKPFYAVAMVQLAQQGACNASSAAATRCTSTTSSGVGRRNWWASPAFPTPPTRRRRSNGGFATAPDLIRFAHGLGDGTLLDRPWADVLFGAKMPLGPASFAAYGLAIEIAIGQWAYQRAGGNPGVGANWSIYPDTGWAGAILSNCDDVPLQEMIGRELQAITGASPGTGSGG
jgi:hypothetical protein